MDEYQHMGEKQGKERMQISDNSHICREKSCTLTAWQVLDVLFYIYT